MPDPVLHILDVGHGNSAVVVDDSVVAIIDAGPKTSLLEFLKDEKITAVDSVLISHADQDHIEGLISLLESDTISIARVRVNANLVKSTEVWADLTFLLDEANRLKKTRFDVGLTTNDSGSFDTPRVALEILAPSPGRAARGVGSKAKKSHKQLTDNSISVVIRLSVKGDPKVLLCGDITSESLDALLADCPTPVAAVVVYPHHGGKSENDDVIVLAQRLAKVTAAKTIVFSIGRDKFENPLPSIVDELRRHLPDVRIACTQMSTLCAEELPTADPPHLSPLFASGKGQRCCCAGTITLTLVTGDMTMTPSAVAHQEFIVASAPAALCRRVVRSEGSPSVQE